MLRHPALFLLLNFVAFAASLGAPTRTLPLLSKQPAFCQQQFGTNYVWLAQAHLPCLGMPAKGCGGGNCGTLSINGQAFAVNNFNNDDHDVCGTCEGCPTVFIGLKTSITSAAHAVEGQNASLVYHPPAGNVPPEDFPDCPALPGPWQTLPDKQINPGCSPAEDQGVLGVVATAAECLVLAQTPQAAASGVNYAVWHGVQDKRCEGCAFRWRGPAERWMFSNLDGATSFAYYMSLPVPRSGPCPPCPVDPPLSAAPIATLSNGRIQASFGPRGLRGLSDQTINVTVGNDAFALGLDRKNCTCSSSFAAPAIQRAEASISFTFASPSQHLSINVTYEIRPNAAFVSKSIALTDTTGANLTREVNSVTAMDSANLQLYGKAPDATRTASNVQFLSCPDHHTPATRTVGAFVTAQNSFVNPSSLAWQLDQNWTTLGSARTLDSVIIGLYGGATSQLEFVEAAAVTEAVGHYLVAPADDNKTVKINIAWCENDYQLDVAIAEDRETYKRIIDRAAEMGLTHILFAPQNSDVSSRQNNTDPWGWEQLLWFGYGQQLRLGLWKPGDPVAASLQEMLDYFKLKGVKPVAYVYPILAFLAGTLPDGGSPPWIVQGTYMGAPLRLTEEVPEIGGVVRSNLANEEFIQWLPETMLQFAEQTGAGGFSFDLTYWEEQLPVASEYAQWAGWRNILSQLHTKRGGLGCGGSRCLVDNRQANHAWGAWMWALGGTYAEPLMSDEQPASWSFYEADLHTDRLAGNKQRQVASAYRAQFCPNDALPGFAFHQTDRDPTALQEKICPGGGRCANHARTRDFDLLGYRYSLLSSIGSGGLNNILNMLPARDAQEFQLFPAEDLAFVRDWIGWADQHVSLLKLTRPLPSLAIPAQGVADGTIMLRGDNTGAMFLFNPTEREVTIGLPLSGDGAASLGFSCVGSTAPVLVKHLSSSERTSAPYNLDVLHCSDVLRVTLPATSARVLEFEQWKPVSAPLVLGSPSSQVTLHAGALAIVGAKGESGTPANLVVLLPPAATVTRVVVNGQQMPLFSSGQLHGLPAVTVRGSWAGPRFRRAQEVSPSSGGTESWSGAFTVPQNVLDQLTARNVSYPVVYNTDPQDSDDANVPWLAPGRLLVFIKYDNPIDDTLNITGDVDGRPLLVRKAYNTIVRNAGRFIGHWADVTPVVTPGKQQTLTLQLPGPPAAPAMPRGVFFDNVETVFTDKLVPEGL